jgi:Xaa-Pro aminopeptidase
MRRASVSHLIVSNPVDVGYLTGFLGGDSFLVVAPGKPVLISDGRYEEDLAPFKPLCRVVIRQGSMTDAVADLLRALAARGGLDSVGVQSEHLTLGEEQALRAAIKRRRLPARLLAPASGLVSALRRVKDAGEVRLISRAIEIQQAALVASLDSIRSGMTELEFAAELEHQMKARGSSNPGFSTIIAAGANASRPHYHPGDAKIRRNGILLIDWGATWKGYHGDMTRTFALGRWPAPMKEVHKIVLEAHEAAAGALRPGKTGAEVDAVARAVIEKAGYGECFSHGLGHGLGMNVHESPRLGKLAGADILEPGHVVTIEPGIYLPGVGGVRIEDDYLVTPRGSRNLCSLPRDLEWASI